MPPEARGAGRSEKDAFVRGARESFAMRKNWAQSARRSSRSPVALEWDSILSYFALSARAFSSARVCSERNAQAPRPNGTQNVIVR